MKIQDVMLPASCCLKNLPSGILGTQRSKLGIILKMVN